MKKVSYGKQHIFNNSKKHIIKSLFNQTITQGKYLKIFENKICKYLKVKHTLACNSGTAASHGLPCNKSTRERQYFDAKC